VGGQKRELELLALSAAPTPFDSFRPFL
jgi:hypothetical protein